VSGALPAILKRSPFSFRGSDSACTLPHHAALPLTRELVSKPSIKSRWSCARFQPRSASSASRRCFASASAEGTPTSSAIRANASSRFVAPVPRARLRPSQTKPRQRHREIGFEQRHGPLRCVVGPDLRRMALARPKDDWGPSSTHRCSLLARTRPHRVLTESSLPRSGVPLPAESGIRSRTELSQRENDQGLTISRKPLLSWSG
jgi:hypothetical protein